MAEEKLSPWQVLRYKFPENEYVLIGEVSDASGFSRSRSLDYMLINLWESRGLAVTGIERKSNRSDWLKELKNPNKQENHYKFCDYFYLLTDTENVAKLEEIPATWGWYHINKSQILKTMKQAPKLNPKPIGKSLMCAMLRRAASKDKFVHTDSLQEQVRVMAENIHREKNYAAERKAEEYDELKEKVGAFERESGLKISTYWKHDSGEIGKAVKLYLNNDLDLYHNRLKHLSESALQIHTHISKALNEYSENGKEAIEQVQPES